MMAQNKSLSTQEVADILHVSKSTIYDLIRRGEIRSYKIGRKVRFTQDDVDAYIARSRSENSVKAVQKIQTHSTLLTPPEGEAPDLIISGQDVLLDILANYLHQGGINAARTYLSGFEGLLSLYQEKVHVCASHLYDGDDYNTSYVRYLMPGVPAVLINLSYRIQGFYVRKGNPKSIHGWEDLRRSDLKLLNRRPGSSSRILLDIQMKKMGILPENIPGYNSVIKSHLTVAAAIAEGEADFALGTERISNQIDGIDFIPLMKERYDLVLRKSFLDSVAAQRLLEILNMPAFRAEISHYSGNDYRDLGKIIKEV